MRASSSQHTLNIIDVLTATVRQEKSIQSVLEIGAGTGLFTLPLAKIVEKVTVIDPSPGMLSVMRHNLEEEEIGNVEIIDGFWPYDLCGETYDLVMAANCLLGFDDLGETLLMMLEAGNKSLCLINPMHVRPVPYDPLLRQYLKEIDHGPDYDCLSLILGMLSLHSIFPTIRMFNMPSWNYQDMNKLCERWAEALNLEREDDHTKLITLLNDFALKNDEGWHIPGSSILFFLWANLAGEKKSGESWEPHKKVTLGL